MLWAAYSMAFYEFLRVSELTSLRWCDASHLVITFQLPSTNQRLTLFVVDAVSASTGQTGSSTCPWHAFECYRGLSGGASHCTLLFQACRFAPLSGAAVTRALRQLLQQAGIDSLQYSSHSFRIGAATTAAAAGLPVWLIKNLARWSSNAYLSYIHQQLRRFTSCWHVQMLLGNQYGTQIVEQVHKTW